MWSYPSFIGKNRRREINFFGRATWVSCFLRDVSSCGSGPRNYKLLVNGEENRRIVNSSAEFPSPPQALARPSLYEAANTVPSIREVSITSSCIPGIIVSTHLRANTILEAGAMPPLFRAAQKVSLASTGELNLGNSSTVKSASLPGFRCTCRLAPKDHSPTAYNKEPSAWCAAIQLLVRQYTPVLWSSLAQELYIRHLAPLLGQIGLYERE